MAPRLLSLILTLVALHAVSVRSWAGNPLSALKKLGTLLDTMAVKGVDRRYIDTPERPWQIILKGNLNQSELKMHASGEIMGVPYSATPNLRMQPAQYAGLWVGYRGYGIGYTFNVGGDRGSYLTAGATGGSYGVNLRIHSFRNSEPSFGLNTDYLTEEEQASWDKVQLKEPIKLRSVIADGYYLFNGKRFSYCAAYDQSCIQKRSAGSLMVGGMYYYGRIDYATDTNADLIYLMNGLGRIKLWQASVGVGYAYNWVPARGVLINAMAMPMLTFVNRIKVFSYATNVEDILDEPWVREIADEEEWDRRWISSLRIGNEDSESYNSGMTVNFNARLSATYNFGRYFVSVNGQFYNFRYYHDDSRGWTNEWFINAAIGVRL